MRLMHNTKEEIEISLYYCDAYTCNDDGFSNDSHSIIVEQTIQQIIMNHHHRELSEKRIELAVGKSVRTNCDTNVEPVKDTHTHTSPSHSFRVRRAHFSRTATFRFRHWHYLQARVFPTFGFGFQFFGFRRLG